MGDRAKRALLILRWFLGLVVLVQACRFTLAPASAHAFSKTGMPDALRLFLVGSEILGLVLFLIPATFLVGVGSCWSFSSWQFLSTFSTACSMSES
jgi:hypothetical protein